MCVCVCVCVMAREITTGFREFLFMNVSTVSSYVITATCLTSLGGELYKLSKIYIRKMNTQWRCVNRPFGT